MTQYLVHYGIHVLLPLLVARTWYRPQWIWAFLIMLSTFLIDLDHLLATPIYDPNRCSIGLHPLHSYWAIGLYFVLIIPKKTRLIGLGLSIHILADLADCLWM